MSPGAGRIFIVLALTALLSGCSSDPEASEAPSGNGGPEASPSASRADPKPTPDPGESGGPAGGPAFEPASTGAPEVSRDGETALRELEVAPVSFAEEATWSDGLRASTRGFSRGTITATGTGAISGAAYVTVEVELQNRSESDVVLDAVVATLLVGEDALPAAPTYDIEEAADLSGVLEPGATATGIYAFQVGADISEGTFYLDVDGDHVIATFSGSFP